MRERGGDGVKCQRGAAAVFNLSEWISFVFVNVSIDRSHNDDDVQKLVLHIRRT